MGFFRTVLSAAVSCLVFSLGFARDANAGTILIHAGHIVDPASGTVRENQYITVIGSRIVRISAERPELSFDRFVDLSNSWVLPGLFDAHTHLTYNYTGALCPAFITDSTGYRALMGLNRAQAMLRAGFTTVRDVGNAANYADTDLRLAVEAGLFEGPKIFNSGKIIAPLGGQSDRVSPDVGNCWSYEYIDADGPDAIRKAIRQNIFYGARLIKVVNDSRGGTHGIYSDEELRVAVDEAHRAGLTIAVHAKEDKTAIPAIIAGADSIEHGYHLTIDAFRLMAKHKTYFVPTDMPPRYLDGNANDIEGNVDAKVKRLAMAYKLGVPLVFGTDATFDRKDDDRGEMAPHYLEIWSRAKIPNMVVLQALTSNAAALLGIDKEAGRISDGFVADIIAVSSDPVLDVSAIGKVHFVMKDGAIVKE